MDTLPFPRRLVLRLPRDTTDSETEIVYSLGVFSFSEWSRSKGPPSGNVSVSRVTHLPGARVHLRDDGGRTLGISKNLFPGI